MVRIDLQYPIQAHGEEITFLEMKRPTVKQLKKISKSGDEVEKSAAMIAELAGIPPSSVDMIDAADFIAINEVIESFFENSRQTGGT